MIEAHGVSFFYDEKAVLKDINLQLGNFPMEVIVGASGSGKTTLLQLLAGKLQLQSGTITIDNTPIKGPKDQLIAGHPGVEWVPQDFQLAPHVSLADHIRRSLWHMPEAEQYEQLSYWLAVFDLEEIAHQKTHKASGGQQQRAAIAAALAKAPDYLLLDEPFNQLDTYKKASLLQLLLQIVKEKNTKIIIVSHETELLLPYAQVFVILEKGEVNQIGTAKEVYFTPKTKSNAELFGTSNFIAKKFESTIIDLEHAHQLLENTYFARPNQLKWQPNENGNWQVKDYLFYGGHQLIYCHFRGCNATIQIPADCLVKKGDRGTIQFYLHKL